MITPIYERFKVTDIPKLAVLQVELVRDIRDVSNDVYLQGSEIGSDDLKTALVFSLNAKDRAILVARVGDVLAGFIACEIHNCFFPLSSVPSVGTITGAYVLPEYRQKGIMRGLEACAMEFFKNHGLEYIELHVMSANAVGKDTWTALGYNTFLEQMRKEIRLS